ncbi:ExbD/TolR family protein [Saccharicrinis sp. FJH2]|uniref:ExbD/TolR family protein n=1 Tax=Saccharicrinis sp. FJH65 TaxID=3344659 RepID=UPI0035F226BA
MAFRKRNKVDSGFSMSSMTDIVFLLLIFFMITSTLVTPVAIRKLKLPFGAHQTSAKPNTTVSITSDMKYYIEGEQVNFNEIEPRLQEKLSLDPDIYIALHTDESVPFSEVGKILDIARRNKYKLILATRGK